MLVGSTNIKFSDINTNYRNSKILPTPILRVRSGYSGTIVGGATWGSGDAIDEMYFDGSDDYLALENQTIETGNSSLRDHMNNKNIATFSFWWKIPSGRDVYEFIFNVNTSSKGNRLLIGLKNSGRRFRHYVEKPTVGDQIATQNASDNTWYLITHRIDGTNSQTFINGAAWPGLPEINIVPTFDATDLWSFGMEWDSSGPSDHAKGWAKRVTLWDVALTDDQISYLYTLGRSGGIDTYINATLSDVETSWNTGDPIKMSDFRGKLLSDSSTVPSSGAISINDRLKNKMFGLPPIIITVPIGDDVTEDGGSSWSGRPFNTYYHDQRYQAIYPAAELQAAGLVSGNKIYSVKFKIVQQPGRDIVDVKVDMRGYLILLY